MKPVSGIRPGLKAALFLSIALLVTISVLWLHRSRNPKSETVTANPSPAASPPVGAGPDRSRPNPAPPVAVNGSSPAPGVATAAHLSPGTGKANVPSTGGDGHISPGALKQMAALEREKAGRTAVQQKIDSQLLYADLMRRGVPIADGVPTQRVDLDRDAQGRVLVDIRADVTDELLRQIQSLGGNVINSFPQYHALRAGIPLAGIEDLAARADVKFVEPAARAMTDVGSVTSQGDKTHAADVARTTFGVDGTGVKIGVLSDSVDHLTNSQMSGDLGSVTVLPGQAGSGTGEGTAMLEIVHDLAPGAQLFFATGGGGTANFANNILQLGTDGCDVIVDDLYYPNEAVFQDAVVAQAVNTVTANGALYFATGGSGNAGNKDDGTAGTWEGDFSDGGATASPLETGLIHSFAAGTNYDTVTGGSSLRVDLFWADPLGASTNDYDVYVLDSGGSSVVASSNEPPEREHRPLRIHAHTVQRGAHRHREILGDEPISPP